MALSLTARLSLLFALGTASVLLGLGWVVARSVEHHFQELDRSEIEGKLALVHNLLTKTQTPEALADLPRHLDEALVGHQGLRVWVLAPDGSVWFASGAGQIPVPLPGNTDLAGEQWVAWEEGEQSFRALTATVPTEPAPATPYTVSIALDVSHHQRFLAGFRHTLAAAIALAALASAALGWAATRAGLQPLRRVTALAAGLSASGLGARLPATRVPAEIDALVAAFNAMLGRLEDSFQRLSAFSADIAHELRTPVSNLMIQTQVALASARDPEQYREILYANLEEYERLAQMIGDMLFLAQADYGLLKPASSLVNLAAEIRGLFDYFDAWAEERGVTFSLEGWAPQVAGDPLMLRRCLSNLLANAIRHTPAGQEVRVRLEDGMGGARLTVTNPGPAIPSEHLPRLFDRFYRVDPTRHRQGEGAGLGLAIVKAIVEAHGGTIAATSGMQGTAFVMVFPDQSAGSKRG